MNSKELQNITMSSGGAYSLATRGAQDVINAAIPIVEEALLKIDLEGKKSFSFADTINMTDPPMTLSIDVKDNFFINSDSFILLMFLLQQPFLLLGLQEIQLFLLINMH